ncbi:MAG: hypothetical protein ACKOOD_00385 [Microbacteriaceae bacterium]
MLEFVLLSVPLVFGLQVAINLATYQAAELESLQLATTLAQNLAAADSLQVLDLPTLPQLQNRAIFAHITDVAARRLEDRVWVCVEYGSGLFSGRSCWTSMLELRQ